MPVELLAVVSVLLAIVGVVGIVVPVLPGSITIIAGLLVWALTVQNATGWVVFGVGTALALGGMTAQYVLTSRNLKRREIPNRSVVIGVLLGIVGLFVLPGFGLFIGFVVGLLASEWYRVRDFRTALSTSWVAVKSVGLGMALELVCGILAAATLGVGLFLHFLP